MGVHPQIQMTKIPSRLELPRPRLSASAIVGGYDDTTGAVLFGVEKKRR